MSSIPDDSSQNGDTTNRTEHLAPLKMNGLTIDRLRVETSRVDANGKVKMLSTETWYSFELREIIRLGSDEDGYTGLSNIQLVDPDSKLFYPPDGYRIECAT